MKRRFHYQSAFRGMVAEAVNIGLRVTPNQHLLLGAFRSRCEWIALTLADHGVALAGAVPQIRRLAMAWPAKPTCGPSLSRRRGIIAEVLGG